MQNQLTDMYKQWCFFPKKDEQSFKIENKHTGRHATFDKCVGINQCLPADMSIKRKKFDITILGENSINNVYIINIPLQDSS